MLELHKFKYRASIYKWSINHRFVSLKINDKSKYKYKYKERQFSQGQEFANMILAPSRFFCMWQMIAAIDEQGFQSKLSKQAQDFLYNLCFAKLGNGREPESTLSQPEALSSALLDFFHEKNPAVDLTNAALASLFLRCYVLEPQVSDWAQVAAFIDAGIFQEVSGETRAVKNRSFTSVYAQQLSLKLKRYQEKVSVKKEFNYA
jgi:hypothetical protein